MKLIKIIKLFCFSVVLLFCIMLLIIGVLAAGENTRAITFGQDTDMLVISQTAEGISLSKNENTVFSDSQVSNQITKYIIDSSKFISPPLISNGIWLVKAASDCISYYFS